MEMRRRKIMSFILIYSFIFGLMIVSPVSQSRANIKKITSPVVTTETIPLQFAHSEDLSVDIAETKVEAQDFKGSEFLDSLDSFNESGIDVYLGSSIIPDVSMPLDYLNVTIPEVYIFDARESALQGDGKYISKYGVMELINVILIQE
jgi:hypothetical protein